jgi:hypothetical protein
MSSLPKTFFRAIAAMILAYPSSAVVYIVTLSVMGVPRGLEAVEGRLLLTAFVVEITVLRGIYTEWMYPWIIFTAVVLFFLLSKGWRWFHLVNRHST